MVLDVFHLANQGQVEACAKAVLEEERRSTAVEPSLGKDGDTVAEEVSLIHVVGRHDDCSACEKVIGVVTRQALGRTHSNLQVTWSPELEVNK